MSTADALLRTIFDRPADDTPRLVYADHLEDDGDLARAEFVRAQVQLARLPASHPDRPALEDREHDLLAAHEAEWLGDARAGLHEWHWDRGFVGEVAASPQVMLDHGDALFAAHPVTRWRVTAAGSDMAEDLLAAGREGWAGRLEAVDFAGWFQEIGELERFLTRSALGRVRELDFTGRPGAFDLPDLIARLPFRDRLEVLRYGSAGWGGPDPVALALALGPARLTELSAPGTELTAAGLRALLHASAGRDLASLDLVDNPLAADAPEAFRDAPCRPRSLGLGATDPGTPPGRLLGCDALADLRELELFVGSNEERVREVAESPFWRQAEDLRLHTANYPVRLGPLWAAPGPPGLRALDLSSTHLADAGVAGLCRAGWAGSVEWLSLAYNPFTDAAARTLADSGRFTRLRTLNLGQPAEVGGLTGAGVRVLAGSRSLADLRLLVVGGVRLAPPEVADVLNAPHWRLAGLGLGGCDLSAAAARELAHSPRLGRLTYLDLSGNPWLGDNVLMPLAESPHLCPLLELDVRGVPVSDRVRQALQGRLGRRLSW